MEGVTLGIGIALSVLTLILPSVEALGAFCIGLFYYPQPLTFLIGGANFNVTRIVIIALLARLLVRGGAIRKTKWNSLDLLILVSFSASTFALATNNEVSMVLVRQSGALFDTVFTYLAVRLAIQTKADLMKFCKMIVIISIPLAFMGAYMCFTGQDPLGGLRAFYGMGMEWEAGWEANKRMGLTRADVVFNVPITFGLFFAGLWPICLGLWKQKVWSRAGILTCSMIMLLGTLCSLSSAPLFSIFITIAMLGFYPFRKYWPVLVFALLGICVFVEMYSNRHFYHLLTFFSFDQATAYYRIGLIDECFGGGMKDHWLRGYGYVGIGPGNVNTYFTWEHKDLVNIYIQKLTQVGFLGLIPFLIVNVLYYRRLVQAGKKASNEADRWMIYCISSALVGWNVAMLTVSALGQVEFMLFMLIGVANSLPAIMAAQKPAARSQAPVPQPQPVQEESPLAPRGRLRRRATSHVPLRKLHG